MNKRILLIEPRFPILYPGQDLFVLQPSLGMLLLAASLEKHGFDVCLINTKVDSKLGNINLSQYAAVGITGHAIQHREIVKATRYIKNKSPCLPIVLGGSHATFSAEFILKQVPTIDFVIRHEGEDSFPLLLKHLSEPEVFQNVPGLSFRRGENIVNNPAKPIYNLDELPTPAFHLLDLKKYFKKIDREAKNFGVNDITLSLGLNASRGCVAQCTFCSARLLQHSKWRICSQAKLIRDLQSLLDHFKPWLSRINIDFIDNTFNSSKKWLLEFCRLLNKYHINIEWRCFCRADKVDAELVSAMASSGCIGIFLGAETANDESLEKMKKGIMTDSVTSATKLFADHNISVILSFMVGFPWERKEHIMQTLKTALVYQSANPVIEGKIFKPTPFPGTHFWDLLKEQKLLKSEERLLNKERIDEFDISRRSGFTYRHPFLREIDLDTLILWFYLKTVIQNIFFLTGKKYFDFQEGLKLRIRLLLGVASTLGAKKRFKDEMKQLEHLINHPQKAELSRISRHLDCMVANIKEKPQKWSEPLVKYKESQDKVFPTNFGTSQKKP
ncbi:MAG: anaerobic magnesium-protoporphyrin monomethyl ester cyclase [Thermodesulfobacteriota bacterium]|nr:anaerobic magnesium-protoporphyrin monomethyl ester cyclase [Thermodesulfobacteriota bacterium]